MSIQVRDAVPADAAGIARVHVAAWQVGYRGQLPADYLDSLCVDAGEQRWSGALNRGSLVLVGLRAGEVVGFISYGASRDEDAPESCAEVYCLYVHPTAWRLGIGRRLLTHVEGALTAAGTSMATLWVLVTNQRGRAFYERQGWVPDGGAKVVELPGVTLDEVRYQRALG